MKRGSKAGVAGLVVFVAGFLGTPAWPADVLFMEPAGATEKGSPRTYRQVTDAGRLKTYSGWLENESAKRALDLYGAAWATMQKRQGGGEALPAYCIALEKGGNHADIGFRLQTADGVEEHPHRPYIKLDPDEWRFSTTLLHETGHVVLAVLTDGREIPTRELASIPHTTAALTDRGTAFNEGFALHLETLAAHLTRDPELRSRYQHERFAFGPAGGKQGEYFRHAADLLSFSQNIARYFEVRENNFAFAPAFRGPDYLRVQLEKSRDFATLRDADQLLQSEGFYASFFFAYLVRGDGLPSAKLLAERQERMLGVLAEMFAAYPPEPDSPHLLRFVETHLRQQPDEAEGIVDVLMDLSHGVLVDADAAGLWREYYLAALRLDLKELPLVRMVAARERWRIAARDDPQVLYSRLGPQIACIVPARAVKLAALGDEQPLRFDINTAEEGILLMIPGINAEEVARWQAERARQPFKDATDFRSRAGLRPEVISELRFPESG